MRNIIVIGAGGNSMDVLDTIEAINNSAHRACYRCIGFLDDDSAKWGTAYREAKVLGPVSEALTYKDACFVFTIGSPFNFWKRGQMIDRLGIPEDRYETLVHPSAFVSPTAKIHAGTVILSQVTIASSVTLGRHMTVLPNSAINHDDNIGDYTVIASGATVSGDVAIGRSCYIGANSSIIGGISIGNRCLVGIGAVVLDDLPSNGVYVGNPAKLLRQTEDDAAVLKNGLKAKTE